MSETFQGRELITVPQMHWNTPEWLTILLWTKLLLRNQGIEQMMTHLGKPKATVSMAMGIPFTLLHIPI